MCIRDRFGGRLRGQIEINVDASDEQISTIALENAGVQRHVAGKSVRKIIIIPEKMVNVII